MKVIYALQPLQKSIMLLGPTPRDDNTESWRPEALEMLRELGFNGTVLVPESETWGRHDAYDQQVKWEWEALEQATVALFWVPRDLNSMPAFTTNVEFGLTVKNGRTLLGFPKDTPKMGYLKALADRYRVPVYDDLQHLLSAGVSMADQLHTDATQSR